MGQPLRQYDVDTHSTRRRRNGRFAVCPVAAGSHGDRITVQPIKLRAIQASAGTTPFEGLFIGFSFF